jgi:2-oxoisovalerate dehydrogenase E1 component alpha subunit
MTHGPGLELHIPVPSARPGDAPDFGRLNVPPAGAVARPAPTIAADTIRDLAYKLIRVLDEEGRAVGPWAPQIAPERLRRGLAAMMMTRLFEDRMFRAQRQG